MSGWIIGGIALAILIALIIMYNSLVRARNHCQEAWSDVDTELKRRYDLIPNLVNTVQGYARHEKELLDEVTRLREECVENTGPPKEQAGSENKLIRVLHTLMARVENYPDLKASQNFLDLQDELSNTEDRIAAARRFYNGNVRENNNLVQYLPTNIMAAVFSFKEQDFFEIEDQRARVTPKVSVGQED